MKKQEYIVYNDVPPPTPVPKGRPRYDEKYLVTRYITERENGLHRSHLAGAVALATYADKHSGGDTTKVNRLRRKFSEGWRTYLQQNTSTDETA